LISSAKLSVLVEERFAEVSGTLNSGKVAPAVAADTLPEDDVNAVNDVGEPVAICPSTADDGMYATGDELLEVKAWLDEEKYPSSSRLPSAVDVFHVVVMETAEFPAAVPPGVRANVTFEGVAETVRDSESVAVSVTLAGLEVIWPLATPANPPRTIKSVKNRK
jgi:hypothetical protein